MSWRGRGRVEVGKGGGMNSDGITEESEIDNFQFVIQN